MKLKIRLLTLAVCSVVILAGCQDHSNHAPNNQALDPNTENGAVGQTPNTDDDTPSAEEDGSDAASLFTELSKYQFVFASGAGAWQTLLNLNADGTFKGHYSDSDMGNTGEGYPDGVMYSSTFEGKFTDPKRVNAYTYSMSIESMTLEHEEGSEEIIDGIKYIYSKPYGLDDAQDIYIYTTEAPLKELPEGFINWVAHTALVSNTEEGHLPFYGLYNAATESGFSSYLIEEIEDDYALFDIAAGVAEIEEQYEAMNNRLIHDDLNQSEMNSLAQDMYTLWDNEINRVWGYLKETLDQEAMDNLTPQQREWITMKENEVEQAGAVYEGGSMRPMVEFTKGAELTRDRVYELLALLPQ